MPMYSDEDAEVVVRMKPASADAWRKVKSCAAQRSATTHGRAAVGVTRGVTSVWLQRRGRMLWRRYWVIGVALLLTVLLVAQLLLARPALGPAPSTTSVGNTKVEDMKAGQRVVASTTAPQRLEKNCTTLRPPVSTEAVVDSWKNDAAATPSNEGDGIGEESRSPTTEVPLVTASPPLSAPDGTSSAFESTYSPPQEQVADASLSAGAKGNTAEMAAGAETSDPSMEELLGSPVHTSATIGNQSSQQQQHQPTPVKHVSSQQPQKSQEEKEMHPSDVPPPRPAPWVKGGGSVRLSHSFSVLTVLADPPLTTPHLSADATNRVHDKEARLLQRATVGLYRSGVTQHASFHEWLLVHNRVLEVATQKREEAVVQAWWRAACSKQEGAAAPSVAELTSTSKLLPRVRVAGLPHTSLNSPQLTKLAFALLHGFRLVVTEYVVLHDLRWTLTEASGLVFGGAADTTGATSTGRANSADPSASDSSNGSVVQREITLALQTLSKNAFPNLPTMVVDQARSGAAEDVHAYHLRVYASQEWRQPEREAALQSQLIAYVQRIQLPTTASPSVAESAPKPVPDTPIASAATTTNNARATAGAEATATSELRVQHGLPIVAYSASAHFHCQRAPLYGIRIPAPLWLRRSRHTSEAPSHSTHYSAQGRNTSTPSPPFTTLCEALVSSQLGLGDAYAVQRNTFYRVFCKEWLQFTLLPSPQTPTRRNAGLATASEAETADLMANLRKVATQRENDVEEQRMDITQGLGDGLCTVEWVAHLKAAQLHYRKMAERERWRAGNSTRFTATTAAHDIAEIAAHPLVSTEASTAVPQLALSNAAGWSPYLNQYATLLFSEDTVQLSRVAGTYLAFLPNVSYALQHIRHTMEDKLALVSLKYAVERTRRFTSLKQPDDREVVCLPSHLSRVHRHAVMYKTQWFLANLALRCVQHKSACLGGLFDSEERTLQNMGRYFSTTSKWSRGEFRVCMSSGAYVSDPFNDLL
ncbi:conserved hypothetical protein [Leishmania braziliensis MHOM/BR/75/M2904]|uniref:Uncharacterized protein n=2 Tax=Leishmania braziliensis TaxID=5660 RepID=A4H9T0_LEIBR|nr:conserved hypothetical protein [Leishmania braziliensis MHOM/BR/75/M2904]CAJ2468242.1 unnamed protein product [Leishmania braziliensis]CAM38156.1 conserved hypothetical protein [Leishmania braziliensis MHOM/BR/75/M2904]